jgi:acetyl-CoA acetyltransferase
MDTDVWILGGYQSVFARNLTKEGLDFADLTREIVDAALAAAKVNAGDIGVVHVANAFGEMFAEQGHLGAMPATVCDGLWDTPASRHEAACASGSVAALAAMADLRSGNYDTALVLGVELEKTVSGDTAPRHLGAAAWKGHEGADAKFLWPSMAIDHIGLTGGGHPVGASGLRMLVDAAKQVSGAAGEYQVEDAKTFGTLNFGGSTATTVSFVVSTTEGS